MARSARGHGGRRHCSGLPLCNVPTLFSRELLQKLLCHLLNGSVISAEGGGARHGKGGRIQCAFKS